MAKTTNGIPEPSLFPPMPAHNVTGAPVFLEPIAGSGERITVAVAVSGEIGSRVVQILQPDKARCLVGDQADALLGIVYLGVKSLRRHLNMGGALDAWRPPSAGLFLGELRHGYGTDLKSVVRMLARDHAFLFSAGDFSAVGC